MSQQITKNAGEKYTEYYQTIESQLSHIRALLNGHCKDVTPNYAHVGDLAEVVGRLAETIEFLGGNINEAKPNVFWTNTGTGFKKTTISTD